MPIIKVLSSENIQQYINETQCHVRMYGTAHVQV